MYLVFNENPIRESKLHYYKVDRVIGESGVEYRLSEVVDAFYRHPEALENAVVPVNEIRTIGIYNHSQPEYEIVQMLYLNQEAVRKLVKS